jgi:hypothetical protein
MDSFFPCIIWPFFKTRESLSGDIAGEEILVGLIKSPFIKN